MAKRVLMCRVDGNFGGVEQHILTLASHYDTNRFQPVVAPIANHGELEERAKSDGFECTFIPMQRKSSVLSASQTLVEIVKQNNIDLIHTFGIRSNTLAYAAKKRVNVPWVITLPNINSTDYQNWLRAAYSHFWNNLLLRNADAVHVISPHLERYIRTLPFAPKNIYTIINGVKIPNDLEGYDKNWLKNQYHLPLDCHMFGTVGRLEEVKGFDILLHAFSKIWKQHKNAYLCLIGDGSQREVLKQLAVTLNLQENIIFVGHTTEVWKHMVGLDTYVCSSRSEGVPYSILEAMACSLPVISTKVGGIPAILHDQQEGMLIPPGNSDALAEGMRDLLSNPSKAAELGRNAMDRVNREFTAEQMTENVQAMYDEILRKNSL